MKIEIDKIATSSNFAHVTSRKNSKNNQYCINYNVEI